MASKKKLSIHALLTGTSALALAASFSMTAAPAFAADENWVTLSSAETETQTATGGSKALVVDSTNTVISGTGAAATSSIAGSTITVSGTNAADVILKSTDATANVIAVTGAGTLTTLTLTKGTITGNGNTNARATVLLDGTGSTSTIKIGNATGNDGLGSTIANTGGGAAIELGNTNAAQALTIDNAHGGSITSTGDAIIVLAKSGASLSVSNNGTISGGSASANAISVAGASAATIANSGTGAITGKITGGSGTMAITNAGTSTITGAIDLGTGASSSLGISGGTITGAVTLGDTGQVLTITGGQIDGAIAGTAANKGQLVVNTSGTYTSNGNISNLTSATVSTGATLDLTGHNNTLAAGTITLAGTGTLKVGNGNVTSATATTIGSGGKLQISGTGTYSGTIDGNIAGNGTFKLSHDYTSVANIGTLAKLAAVTVDDSVTLTNAYDLKATTITVGGGTSGILTQTAGTVAATTLSLGSGSTYNYGGGNLTGTFDGTSGATGTVNINSNYTSAAAIGSTNGIATLAVAANKTLTLGADIKATNTNVSGTIDTGNAGRTITGNLSGTGTGTIKLQGNTNTLTGNLNTLSGDTLNVTINGATNNDSGTISVGGTASIASGTKLKLNLPTPALTALLDSTLSHTFIIASGTGTNTGTLTILDSGSIYLSAIDVSTAGNRTIRIDRAGYQTIATNSNTASLGSAINSKPSTSTGTMGTFITNLQAASTKAQANEIMSQALPQADNGTMEAVFDTTNAVADAIETRLASLRSGTDMTGMAAGDTTRSRHVWAQAFGSLQDQGNRKGVYGYDTSTGGMAFGVDKDLDSLGGGYAGVSVSYASSSIDSKDNLKSIDGETYQANIYATKKYVSNWFVDGLAGFGYHQFDTSRSIPSGASTATGDFDGQTYMARLGAGKSMALGQSARLILTPSASLTYSYSNFADYTETGAGALNLAVQQDSTQQLKSNLGASLGYGFTTAKGTLIKPAVHAAWIYDFIGDSQSDTSSFTSGGPTFATKGLRPERNAVDLGANVDIYGTQNIDLMLQYDFEKRNDYSAHSGGVRLRYNF